MASNTQLRAIHATLTATTVDTAVLTGGWDSVQVVNRGSNTLYVTVDRGAATPSDPTSGGNNTFAVPAGNVLSLDDLPGPGSWTVKILGNGDAYSVMGFGRPNGGVR